MTTHLEHLTEKARQLVDAPLEERIEYVYEDRWIPYPRADRIIQKLEDLLARPRTLRVPGLSVIAPSNNGKSFIAKRFSSLHPCTVNEAGDANVQPVIRITAPEKANEIEFYNSILAQIGGPYKATDKLTGKADAVYKRARRVGLRMVMVDEVHNLLAGLANRQGQFRNVLKNLAHEAQVNVVVLGTEQAYNAVHSDEQLANRFPPTTLPRWDADDDWGRLIVSFERRLPLAEPSDLAYDHAEDLHTMTGGLIGELHDVLCDAAAASLREGREHIDWATVERLDYVPPSERKRGGKLRSGKLT
jgi:hypothetical protein